jgi:hypothetical protein
VPDEVLAGGWLVPEKVYRPAKVVRLAGRIGGSFTIAEKLNVEVADFRAPDQSIDLPLGRN